MKRRLGLSLALVLLLLCWCGTAFAIENSYGVEFHPMSQSQYTLSLPDGLVATTNCEGNTLTIKVDADASDWARVLADSTSPQSISLEIKGISPAGETVTGCYASGAMLSSKEDADAAIEFQEWYIGEWLSDMTDWTNSIGIGTLDPANSLFAPRATSAESPDTLLVCWINSADPSYRYYEWLDIIVEWPGIDMTWPATGAFSVPYRFISAETLEPCKDQITSSHLEVTDIQNGSIVYKILSDEVMNEQPQLSLSFKAPKKAVRARLSENYGTYEGNVQDGVVTFAEVASLDPTRFDETRFSLAWYDKNDKLVDYGFFVLYTTLDEDAPWPNYVEDWQPVPASRITVQNGVANAGIEYAYDESIGTIHTSHDGTIKVTGELGSFDITVTPPEGAAYYRTSGQMGWSSFRGPMPGCVDEVETNITLFTPEVYPASDNWQARHDIMLQPVKAGPMTVYLQTDGFYRFGGGVSAVYWYANKEDADNDPLNPMLKEFICFTSDELAATEQTDMIEDEASITSPVKKILCIGKHPWRLKVLHHPQKGQRSRHYELQMVNETGAAQALTEPVVFYMPYPEDLDPSKEYDYDLLHFDSNYRQNVNVSVTATPYGLRFEVSSLSPFVLSYDEVIPETPSPAPTEESTPTPTATPTATPTSEPTAEPTATPTAVPTAQPTATPAATPTLAPTASPTATPEPTNVPKTGDESNLAMFGLMAILSLAGLALLGKTKKGNA